MMILMLMTSQEKEAQLEVIRVQMSTTEIVVFVRQCELDCQSFAELPDQARREYESTDGLEPC